MVIVFMLSLIAGSSSLMYGVLHDFASAPLWSVTLFLKRGLI